MEKTTSYIIVRLQVEGLHKWTAAEKTIPAVGYLSHLHRHNFHIEIKKQVVNDDRQIEFIMYKRQVNQYLTKKYYDSKYDCLNFDSMSCEMIAKELLEAFSAEYVMVDEDGENGAEIFNG